jgi:hypothetical protein
MRCTFALTVARWVSLLGPSSSSRTEKSGPYDIDPSDIEYTTGKLNFEEAGKIPAGKPVDLGHVENTDMLVRLWKEKARRREGHGRGEDSGLVRSRACAEARPALQGECMPDIYGHPHVTRLRGGHGAVSHEEPARVGDKAGDKGLTARCRALEGTGNAEAPNDMMVLAWIQWYLKVPFLCIGRELELTAEDICCFAGAILHMEDRRMPCSGGLDVSERLLGSEAIETHIPPAFPPLPKLLVR